MKLNLKLRFTIFLVTYLVGFTEMILKVSKCFSFRLQVYETWVCRVITPLEEALRNALCGWRYFIELSLK